MVLAGLVGCVSDTTGDSSSNGCSSDADCTDGQKCFSQAGEQFCVTPCISDADCGAGEACTGGACLAGDVTPTPDAQPDGTPEATPDMNPDAQPGQPDPTPTPTPDPGNNSCQAACTQLVTCMDQVCTQPIVEQGACEQQCNQNPAEFQADLIISLSCEEIQGAILDQACGDPQVQMVCDCPEIEPNATNAGSACSSEADCQGGTLMVQCVPEVDPMTSEATGFVGGYCIAAPCNGDAQCGEGNRCVGLETGQGVQNFCLGGCEGGNARGGCRDGYGCWNVSEMDPTAAVCFPECDPADPEACGEFTCDEVTGSCI